MVKEEDTTQLQVPLAGVYQELFLVYLDFRKLQDDVELYYLCVVYYIPAFALPGFPMQLYIFDLK